MKTKQLKLIGAIFLGLMLAVCFSLLVMLNISLALECLILILAVSLGLCLKFGKHPVPEENGVKTTKQFEQTENQSAENTVHKIRTFANAVMGFADVLRDEPLSEEQTKFTKAIYTNTKSLVEVIDEMCRTEEIKPGGVWPLQSSKWALDQVGKAGKQAVEVTERTEKQTELRPKAHILVAVDVPENRLLDELLLQKAGYRVTTCCNGKEAVELAQKQKFDVILMDLKMPVMNGLDATEIIKSQGLNANTNIIAMTASSMKSDKLLCAEAGCDDYIAKPINKDLLLRKIERLIRESKQIEMVSQGGDITSLLLDDPNYQKTIEMFINNLPERIRQMHEALDEGNLEDLALKIHALKGLGSFAGFAVYTEKARAIEEEIENNELGKIRQQLDEMAKLCLRTKFRRP